MRRYYMLLRSNKTKTDDVLSLDLLIALFCFVCELQLCIVCIESVQENN